MATSGSLCFQPPDKAAQAGAPVRLWHGLGWERLLSCSNKLIASFSTSNSIGFSLNSKPGQQHGKFEAPSVLFNAFFWNRHGKALFISGEPAKLSKQKIHSLGFFQVLLIPVNKLTPDTSGLCPYHPQPPPPRPFPMAVVYRAAFSCGPSYTVSSRGKGTPRRLTHLASDGSRSREEEAISTERGDWCPRLLPAALSRYPFQG